MKTKNKRIIGSFTAAFLLLALLMTGCGGDDTSYSYSDAAESSDESSIDLPVYGESYDSRDEVALYIHMYGELPENYITKKDAKALGWEGGSVEQVSPGKCIGGDYFGNYEEVLPTDEKYTECDIDTLGKKGRGSKRIIYADEDTVYYTDDHYESFKKATFDPDNKEYPTWK
ncbi:MAG: ribonuclease [Lachnospiraceae bacterium]|nr:ribonuclease [Lachnospiraceae bacterium]